MRGINIQFIFAHGSIYLCWNDFRLTWEILRDIVVQVQLCILNSRASMHHWLCIYYNHVNWYIILPIFQAHHPSLDQNAPFILADVPLFSLCQEVVYPQSTKNLTSINVPPPKTWSYLHQVMLDQWSHTKQHWNHLHNIMCFSNKESDQSLIINVHSANLT